MRSIGRLPTAPASRRVAAASPTSSASICTRPLEPPASARSASAFSGSRQVAITCQPALAYCLANSSPSPRDAPVINAVGMSFLPLGFDGTPRRDLDLDLHARVDQLGDHGGVGRPDLAEML